MKRLEITLEEHLLHEYIIEWQDYIKQRWIDAGFDMNKPVTQEFGNKNKNIVFTQED